MRRCPSCEKESLASAHFCGICGKDLRAFREGNNRKENSFLLSGFMVDETLREQVHAILMIEKGFAVGTKFYLTSNESYIGRWDADNGVFPDIDLDPYDPEAKVSRKHAKIIYEDGAYFIEDLGSTNGTFVNRSKRLPVGVRQELKNGDEIIVGKTFLRFYILQEKNDD
ncbi:MAG: FHA domain-containing protein [Pyrinomonadaceae bacterium]|nr:FHA domain-containing protein [Pyrinomonadaceae bacterium]MCX7639708.1 FHA domain-containing protein [Pyrinomonadaceae bacterium]MDW8304610.1 FHA domain-containing protein [Acidobacteriota bacterium]